MWRIGPYGVARLAGLGWAGLYGGVAVALCSTPFSAVQRSAATGWRHRSVRRKALDLATGRLLELCVRAETETGIYLGGTRRDVEVVVKVFREIARDAQQIRRGLRLP